MLLPRTPILVPPIRRLDVERDACFDCRVVIMTETMTADKMTAKADMMMTDKMTVDVVRFDFMVRRWRWSERDGMLSLHSCLIVKCAS